MRCMNSISSAPRAPNQYIMQKKILNLEKSLWKIVFGPWKGSWKSLNFIMEKLQEPWLLHTGLPKASEIRYIAGLS